MRFYFEVGGDEEDNWGPFTRDTPDGASVIVLWQNPGKEFMEQTSEANLAISTHYKQMGWWSMEAPSYEEAVRVISSKFGLDNDEDIIFVREEDIEWE